MCAVWKTHQRRGGGGVVTCAQPTQHARSFPRPWRLGHCSATTIFIRQIEERESGKTENITLCFLIEEFWGSARLGDAHKRRRRRRRNGQQGKRRPWWHKRALSPLAEARPSWDLFSSSSFSPTNLFYFYFFSHLIVFWRRRRRWDSRSGTKASHRCHRVAACAMMMRVVA